MKRPWVRRLLRTAPSFVVLFAAALGASGQAAQLMGKVTAAREGAVRVEIPISATAGPVAGDLVDFKTEVRGFELGAGKGVVAEVDGSLIWVRIIEGRPGLGMTAIVHATGSPIGVTPGRPPGAGGGGTPIVGAGSPGAGGGTATGGSGSRGGGAGGGAGTAGMSISGVPGYFEMLLPVDFAPHIHEETSDSWGADSLWGFHGVERTVPEPQGTRPDWTIDVSGGPPFPSDSGGPMSAEEASRVTHQAWSSGNGDRFSGRRAEGYTRCVGFSVEAPGYRRLWVYFCDHGGLSYGITFRKDVEKALPDDDETVERMVRSFRPLR